MSSTLEILTPPYLYEIHYTGSLILRIVRHDLDEARFRELDFDELSEDVQEKILIEMTNEE